MLKQMIETNFTFFGRGENIKLRSLQQESEYADGDISEVEAAGAE